MKHDIKKKPGSIIELEATLDHKEFLAYYEPVYQQALSSVQLKGFRQGAAPRDLADQMVNKEKVFEEAVSGAVRETLKKLAEENSWELIDQPKIEILENEDGLVPHNGALDQAQRGVGLKFKAALTLFPEVQPGDYKKIAAKIVKDKKPVAVDEKEIERSIEWLRNSRAKLIAVNRPSQNGDVLDVEFEGFVDGKSLDQATSKADRFVLGEGKFVPGFEENLIGKKAGDKAEFSVTFPKDYWHGDMQGKKVDFKTGIHAVFSRDLPELNDEFVKGLGTFTSVEEFTKNVKDGLQKEKEEKETERLHLKMLDALRADAAIDVPQAMVERTLDNMVQEYAASAADKKDPAELRVQLAASAQASVMNHLIIYKIAQLEKLDPEQKEVEEEANRFLARTNFSKSPKIDPQQLYDYVYGIVRNKKVFTYLDSLK